MGRASRVSLTADPISRAVAYRGLAPRAWANQPAGHQLVRL